MQTNSATAEQSAAASEELSSQALLLKEMIGKFKLTGFGTAFFRTAKQYVTYTKHRFYDVPKQRKRNVALLRRQILIARLQTSKYSNKLFYINPILYKSLQNKRHGLNAMPLYYSAISLHPLFNTHRRNIKTASNSFSKRSKFRYTYIHYGKRITGFTFNRKEPWHVKTTFKLYNNSFPY